MTLRRFVLAALVLVPLVLAVPSQAAPAALEGVPHFKHVVVLWEENENAEASFAPNSPFSYLSKTLAAKGVYLPNYYGTGHVSLDNYISFASGQPGNPLTYSDCLAVSLYTCTQSSSVLDGGRNLADQLEDAHLSWKQYTDGAPTPCFHGPYTAGDVSPDPYQGNSTKPPAKDVADRHVPWLYFSNIMGNQARCNAHVRPYTDLATDFAAGTVPDFSFITPDTCHDGHDNPCANGKPGGLVGANTWLAKEGPPLVSWLAAHDGLLVVTFDENGFTSTSGQPSCAVAQCPSLGAGGRVGAVFVSPRLRQGATVTTSYDHHGLLRTVEDSFGIGEHLNLAGVAKPMTDVFAAAPAATPSAASTTPGRSAGSAGLPGAGALAATGMPWTVTALGAVLLAAGTSVRRRFRGACVCRLPER